MSNIGQSPYSYESNNTSPRFFWISAVILSLLFVIVASLLLLNRYQSRMHIAEERLENLAAIYDDNILLLMQNLESMMRAVGSELINGQSIDNLDDYLGTIADELPHIRSLIVLNSEGIVVADSLPDDSAIGRDNREGILFTMHLDTDSDFLFIREPLLRSLDDTWALPVSYGIHDEAGNLLAVIVAPIKPDYFSGALSSSISDDDEITGYIFDINEILLTTIPFQPEQTSLTYPGHELFTVVNSTPDQGILQSNGFTSTAMYTIAYRFIETYGFTVVFAQPQSVIQNAFFLDAVIVISGTILLSGITIFILNYLARQTQKISTMRDTLALSLEAANAGVWEWNVVDNQTYWDAASEKIHGLEIGEYQRTHDAWRKMIHPDDVEQAVDPIQNNFNDKNDVTVEYRVVRPDGMVRNILSQAIVVRDSQKKPVKLIGVHIDVTGRKEAELKAIRERNLLRTIIDNVPDYIFVKDRDGRFIETNIAHANAANLTREEMLHRHVSEVYEADFAQQFHEDDDVVLKTGQPIINEERLSVGANNAEKWVLTTKVPLRDLESNIIGLIGISRDITHRRQAEQKRLEAERLRIEVEKERELIGLKQRFITTASHNFRTPLSIIRSSTSILQRYAEQLSPEDQQTKYSKIQNQIDHMLRLLDDVLRIGAINAGKLELEYTTFQLETCCQRMWNDFIILDEGKHPTEFLYEATIEEIIADEQLMQHAIMNLLSNAFKYTPAGKQIKFSVSNDDRWFHICIQDEGIGIPESEIKHLFQPFSRASNVENIKGTGLGLVITKEYIELHGGTIAVESEENKGTTFKVQLPIKNSNISGI